MIKDRLFSASSYYGLSKYIELGLKWLQNTDLNNIADGKYYIHEDKVYANVQTYETKSDAKFESHKKYIDIQYVIKGSEKVGITDILHCTTCVEYNSETDIEFYDSSTDEEYVKLEEGSFLILYPQDVHKPSIVNGENRLVKKVVVKVLVQ